MERLNIVRTKILGMKKCMNVKFVVLLAFMLLPLVSSWGQDNVIDEVVWVVGDEAILKSDVEEVRLDALYNGRRFDGDPYCVIPEEIAVQKLFLHQAALDSIEVSESEVVSQVDFMINQYVSRIGSMEKMEEYWNKSATQIRETLRENAREGLTVQRMQQKLVGEVKITPAEVRRYYQSLPQDSIPYIPTQVEVQIITQKPRIPVEEVEEVKKRLREFTDRINKGETSFSTLARMYSEDRASAINGGEMPFYGRGQLDPSFANVAFNLQDPTKVSKVVESEYGFHIIQLIEKRGDRIKFDTYCCAPIRLKVHWKPVWLVLILLLTIFGIISLHLKRLQRLFRKTRILGIITVCCPIPTTIHRSSRCRNFLLRLPRWSIK